MVRCVAGLVSAWFGVVRMLVRLVEWKSNRLCVISLVHWMLFGGMVRMVSVLGGITNRLCVISVVYWLVVMLFGGIVGFESVLGGITNRFRVISFVPRVLFGGMVGVECILGGITSCVVVVDRRYCSCVVPIVVVVQRFTGGTGFEAGCGVARLECVPVFVALWIGSEAGLIDVVRLLAAFLIE